MKTMELENYGVFELQEPESRSISGGNPFWIGVGIGFGVMALYDFANGVYAGIKLELAQK